MSISQETMALLNDDAQLWWLGLRAFEKMKLTGATDDVEAERRFQALNVADRWDLSIGHIKTVANFNW